MEHFEQRLPGKPYARLELVEFGMPNSAGQRPARQDFVNLDPAKADAYDKKWQAISATWPRCQQRTA